MALADAPVPAPRQPTGDWREPGSQAYQVIATAIVEVLAADHTPRRAGIDIIYRAVFA